MTHYVLVHSPLVGPRTWAGVARVLRKHGHDVVVPDLRGFADAGPPYVPKLLARLYDAIEAAATDTVLVGHSGATLLLPSVIGRAYVFVDGSVPPGRGAATYPQWMLDHLDALTVGDRLPPWSQWWGDGDVMAGLVPDPAARDAIEQELPELPRAYFDEPIPVPDGWDDRPCCYLQLSAVCAPDADEAAARGWPVTRFEAGHLHLVVDPDAVATALERLTAVALG